jgi:hypothetical protein
MVRVGAFLLLLSPFVPQCDQAGRAAAPVGMLAELGPALPPIGVLDVGLWLSAPLAIGLLLLAGAWRPSGSGPVVRGAAFVVLLGFSFVLSTLGSILLTETGAQAQSVPASFPLSLLLFVLPILFAAVALARTVGGDFASSSGGFVRLSLGLLLALDGLFLLDGGWVVLLTWAGQTGNARVLPGAWVAPVGGLLVAAGELLSRFRTPPVPALDYKP